MFIDSHCHLHRMDLTPYQNDMSKALLAAKAHGVTEVLNVCVRLDEVATIVALAEQFPEVYGSIGVHPSEVIDIEPTVDMLVTLASHEKIIAIGETGLDYHYNSEGLAEMQQRFRIHVEAARQCAKPLIVHSRAANEDSKTVIREAYQLGVAGVMHCFTETWDLAKVALESGFYISFSGIITFKNASNVVEVARQVPMDRILIETDAPYLTPVPFRGKPNAPEYVRYTAAKIAEIKGITLESVAEQTSQNYRDLFFANVST